MGNSAQTTRPSTTLPRLVAVYVAKFLELSAYKRVLVVVSFALFPCFFMFGFAEQALNPLLRATSAIYWFVGAGIVLVLWFWACEELTELRARNRVVALLIFASLVVILIRHEMGVAAEEAEQVADDKERSDAREMYQAATSNKLLQALKGEPRPSEQSPLAKNAEPPTIAAAPKARSFVYVAPGVWLNNATWDFLVRHSGPDPVNNIEIVFSDEDRAAYGRKFNQPFGLEQLTKTLTFPEIDPIEGFWAKQFLWTPLTPNSENYKIVVSSREGRVFEDLKIVGTGDSPATKNWQYAMKITDPFSNKVLLHCRDAMFPISEEFPSKLSKCFPDSVIGRPKH